MLNADFSQLLSRDLVMSHVRREGAKKCLQQPLCTGTVKRDSKINVKGHIIFWAGRQFFLYKLQEFIFPVLTEVE